MDKSEPTDAPDGKSLLWLRRLVVALALTMMGGLIVLVGLAASLVMSRDGDADWPGSLALPDGESVLAVTRGTDWLAVVTRGTDGVERIHIMSPDGETLRQTVPIR